MFTLIVIVESTCPECVEIVSSNQDSGIQLYTLLSTSLLTGNYITHELCLGWCWVVGVLYRAWYQFVETLLPCSFL